MGITRAKPARASTSTAVAGMKRIFAASKPVQGRGKGGRGRKGKERLAAISVEFQWK